MNSDTENTFLANDYCTEFIFFNKGGLFVEFIVGFLSQLSRELLLLLLCVRAVSSTAEREDLVGPLASDMASPNDQSDKNYGSMVRCT